MTNEEVAQSPERVEITTTELLQLAMKMHRDKRLAGAEKCYKSLLEIEPDNANALHFLGVLLHQTGRSQDGLPMIQRSLALDARIAAWHNNLGNVLLASGQFEAAATAYGQCAALDPSDLDVLNNLGVLCGRLDQPEKAIAYLERAIAGNPKFIGAHSNLATVLSQVGRLDEAFSHLADALALGPQDPEVRRYLVMLYCKAGRIEEAKEACSKWLLDMPDSPKALHMLAAVGGTAVPDRAADAYIVEEFDGFAVSFDAKLAFLQYKAPQWVGETVARLLPLAAQSCSVLDIGCGTGLCAAYLKPYAKNLVGVDLSAKMLELAAGRNLYDGLFKAELVQFLTHCDERFDLAVSADTLIYFGRLDRAFYGVRRVLQSGGHWVFTLEAHQEAADYVLQLHGRYSHSREYVQNTLLAAGFCNLEFKSVVLRFEGNKPVDGWLVNAQVGNFASAPTE